MEYRIERNISAYSSWSYPYCVVNDSGKVVRRVKTVDEGNATIAELEGKNI